MYTKHFHLLYRGVTQLFEQDFRKGVQLYGPIFLTLSDNLVSVPSAISNEFSKLFAKYVINYCFEGDIDGTFNDYIKALSNNYILRRVSAPSYMLLQIYWADGKEAEVTAEVGYTILALDQVISETVKMLQELKDQALLEIYIDKMTLCVKQLPYMSKITQNKLMNFLNALAHPGGPYFAPREVRQKAV